MAFDDPEPIVRGFAWHVIGDMWRRGAAVESLKQLAADVFVERFRIRRDVVSGLVITAWLEGISHLLDRAKRDGQRMPPLDDYEERFLRAKAGTDLDDMQQSVAAARSYLGHSNPDRRIAALVVLFRKAAGEKWFRDTVENVLKFEADTDVYANALSIYIEVWTQTKASRALRFLAGIVLNESCSTALREIAYQGLFQIRDCPATEWPVTKAALGRFRFPEDIDRAFLSECIRGTSVT